MDSRSGSRHRGEDWGNSWPMTSEGVSSSIPGYAWDCRHSGPYTTSHPGTPDLGTYVDGSISHHDHLSPPMRPLQPYREVIGHMNTPAHNQGYGPNPRWYNPTDFGQFPEDVVDGIQVTLGYEQTPMGYFHQPDPMFQPDYNIRRDKSPTLYAPSPGHEFAVRPDLAPIAHPRRKNNSYARSTSPPDMASESTDDRQSASPASQSSTYTVTCEYCGFVLTGAHAKGNLKRHQAGDSCTSLAHRKLYPCINCPDKVYKRSDALRNHQRRKGCTPL